MPHATKRPAPQRPRLGARFLVIISIRLCLFDDSVVIVDRGVRAPNMGSAYQRVILSRRCPEGPCEQLLRKLKTLEKSLSENGKIVIPSGSELVNVIGEMAGVLPLTEGAR